MKLFSNVYLKSVWKQLQLLTKGTGTRCVLLIKRTIKSEKIYEVPVSEIEWRLDKTVNLETRRIEDMSLMITPQSPHLSSNWESRVNTTDDLTWSEEGMGDPGCWNIWHSQGCYLRGETMLRGAQQRVWGLTVGP